MADKNTIAGRLLLDESEVRKQQIRRRLIAGKAFYSGEARKMRTNAVKDGELPWKIIRYQHIVNPEQLAFPIDRRSYVRPATFEKHLRFLSKSCNVISLSALIVQILERKPIPDNTVVITFDGGFLDTYAFAFPLLQKYKLPATFFLASGFIGTMNSLWQDKISYALVGFKHLGLKLPPFTFLDEQFAREIMQVAPEGQITAESISILIQALYRCSPMDRYVALHFCLNLVKDKLSAPEEPSFMDWPHVQHLHSEGYEIGTLGERHAFYTELELEEMATDLKDSLSTFKNQRLHPVPVFCFPGGLFNIPAVLLLQQAGIRYAVTVGRFPHPDYQESPLKLFGRVPISEGSTFCTELFACRMWELEIGGIQY